MPELEFPHDRTARVSRQLERVRQARWRLIEFPHNRDEEKTTYNLQTPPGTKFKARRRGRDFNALTVHTPPSGFQETKGLTLDEVEEMEEDAG